MKKAFLFLFFIGCAATVGFGQKGKTPGKVVETKTKQTATPNKIAAKITAAEWTTLSRFLAAEDWATSAALADRLLNRVKVDDEKKQIAQLRYIYLYALAGKIFKLAAQPNAIEENAVRVELVRAAARFAGKEFVLPARQFLGDCKNVVNYICTVKNSGNKVFRTTATGRSGAEIHSFDYISFDRTIDLKGFNENKTFLGGFLRKVEFNEDLKKPWIMRLIFNRGFVRVVVAA